MRGHIVRSICQREAQVCECAWARSVQCADDMKQQPCSRGFVAVAVYGDGDGSGAPTAIDEGRSDIFGAARWWS